jgi:hypothetical protein
MIFADGLVININKSKFYYKNNTLHRLNGPAYIAGIVYGNKKEWAYYGQLIICKTQEEFEKLIKLKVFWDK